MNYPIAIQAYDSDIIYQTNVFLEHIGKTKSLATLQTYTNKLSVFTKWWHVTPMRNGLESHLEGFRKYVDGRYPSARSKNLVLSVVRNLLRYLYSKKIIKEDVASNIKNFKVGEGFSKSALDKYQLEKVFTYLREDTSMYAKRNRVIIALTVANGLRANEVANILLEDFSWRDGDRIINLLRKGFSDKSNYSILNPNTAQLIDEFVGDRTEGYLFESQRGGGLTSTSISKIGKAIFRACDLDDRSLSFHSLRHSTAAAALEAGVNIVQIMVMLNHRHLSSTQIYARFRERAKNAAEKAISFNF